MSGGRCTNRTRPFLVVFGDSVAVGRDDPDPAGGWIGCARRLTEQLDIPPSRVVNVAQPGATLAHVARDQLQQVHGLRPRLALLNCGLNDALLGFDQAEVACHLEAIADWAREVAAVLIAGSVPTAPVLEHAVMSQFRRRRTRQRIDDLNDELRRTADGFGMRYVSPEMLPRLTDPTVWSPDGIHLNADGHAYVASVIRTTVSDLLDEQATRASG